jgi:hypothetical protein
MDSNRALDNIPTWDPVSVAQRHGSNVDYQIELIACLEKPMPAVGRINRCGVCPTAHGSASSARADN